MRITILSNLLIRIGILFGWLSMQGLRRMMGIKPYFGTEEPFFCTRPTIGEEDFTIPFQLKMKIHNSNKGGHRCLVFGFPTYCTSNIGRCGNKAMSGSNILMELYIWLLLRALSTSLSRTISMPSSVFIFMEKPCKVFAAPTVCCAARSFPFIRFSMGTQGIRMLAAAVRDE